MALYDANKRLLKKGLLNCSVHFFCGFLFLPLAASALEPVVLTDDRQEYSLGQHLEIFEDTTTSVTPEEAASPALDEKFLQSKVDVPSFGYTRFAYWLRFHVENKSSKQTEWFLNVNFEMLNNIDIFEYSETGKMRPIARTGLLVPHEERPLLFRYHVVPLNIPTGEGMTLYVRIVSELPLIFPLTLSTFDVVVRKNFSSEIVTGIYVGILLAMILYNAGIYVVLRDKAYLFYITFIAAALLSFMSVLGVLQMYFFPASQWWVNRATITFFMVMAFFGGIFVRKFLLTQKYTPTLDRVLVGFIVLFAASIFACQVVPMDIFENVINVVGGVYTSFILVTGIICYRRGFKPASYFVIAWGVFLVGFSIATMTWLGILPHNDVTSQVAIVGNAMEAILLSFALAYRIRTIEYARDKAQSIAKTTQRLKRYFPKQLVEKILSEEDEVFSKSERKNITILFTDLTGFTDLTERVAPERVSIMLNEYLSDMTRLIDKHGGTLDKIVGDGIMAIYGAPADMDNREQAHSAVATAIEMHQHLFKLGQSWDAVGIEHKVRLRIGIHQDYVTVGNFGSDELMSYTAIGAGVNFAARLEKGCSPGKIMVSFSVHALTKDTYSYGDLVEREYKGFARKQKVAELNPHGPPSFDDSKVIKLPVTPKA